ncbi:hypothetical protein J1N35_022567 [Gossypium stocksii]|uniref:OTU domain-containing protein n=1 Tax=Gossypium stocksii TaxID=47602 RepID=A0A9D4A195_9ROSI|nr:hypothetical protein J1N35_022567 [Gossypium stocksii]
MSNFYRSNLNEGNEISMPTSPFFTDRVFKSREELMQWVQNMAFSLGYIIVTRRSKAKENGVVSYVTLICDCGSEYKFKESSKKSGTKKTNYKFRLVGSYLKQYDGWTLRIVGVTSTNKTFSIAFAFIINEKKENYNWALTCLKLTLEECMYPHVIVTDREWALMNACQQVFPYATRLLCRWHITENIKKHCRQSIKSQHEWDSFHAMWTVLVESPMWILYTENYRKLQSMLSEYPDFLYITNVYINSSVLKSLDQVWLSKYKEMFMSIWIDRHLNFGERTTNRVESQHAKLKKYLFAKNSSLDKFIGCIDQIVKSQLTSIYESFEKNVLWRKLDLSPSTFVENEDICCDDELKMFKENFTKHQAPRRRSHSTTSKSVGLDLVELNKEPTRHNLNQEPSEQVSEFINLNQMLESCDTHPLMKEIPNMFHPCITHVQDVRGDGNCGFRVISVCLGYGKDQWLYVRHQLLDELLSSYDVYARVFTDGIDELRNSLCFSQSPYAYDRCPDCQQVWGDPQLFNQAR